MPRSALPAASMELIRINGNGVKPMPAIRDALDRAPVQRDALSQALPSNQSQPVGAELGEPACTYDPVLPPKCQIIRGLW
ncbi:MAG: hypothetical protein NTY67_07485 [Cyanobacteria bacterium]|nr:hypothetical protein [Cyanobacteriota bacterium]